MRAGGCRTLGRSGVSVRSMSLPAHEVVPMPALSPTMEAGTIGEWLVKEGGAFGAGEAICEVETDKATVTFDAQDDGFLAKILVVGGEEVVVGSPIFVTVEEEEDVAAFANFTVDVAAAPAAAAPAAPAPAAAASAPVTVAAAASGGRVFASPLARKLAREAGMDLVAMGGAIAASGPNGRIVAADVMAAIAGGVTAPVDVAVGASAGAAGVQTMAAPSMVAIAGSEAEMAALLTRTKQEVPHYYLSVEINMAKLLRMRSALNATAGSKEDAEPLAVQDFVIKAAAGAMKTVPDINGEWNGSFVRQYDQCDINVVMGSGGMFMAPVIRDVGSLGVKAIADATASFEDGIYNDKGEVIDASALGKGTFSIHNLGKSTPRRLFI